MSGRAWILALVAGAALGGCAAPPPQLARAVVEPATVDTAIRQQRWLDGRADCLVPAGEASYAVLAGDAPILVTAPHATQPFREGRYRFADGGGTGALALALHRLTGATAVVTTYASPSDPNYYDDNAFKQEVARQVERLRPRLVIDLHGSHPSRPYDVDLGTMRGRSLLGHDELLAEAVADLKAEGLANLSRDFFSASENHTVTRYAAGLGVPALQLEINAIWLKPADGDLAAHRFAQLLQALVRLSSSVAGGQPVADGVDLPGKDDAACASRVRN